MARVMMIGYGPLPAPGVEVVMAPALRTRHLLKGVLEGGHAVNLFTLPLPGIEEAAGDDHAMVPEQYEGLHYQRFTSHSERIRRSGRYYDRIWARIIRTLKYAGMGGNCAGPSLCFGAGTDHCD